jgi:hypothetical protein
MMKKMSCWGDLKPYGFHALTGEASGVPYRIRFDVTENGRRLIGTCFAIPKLRLGKPWHRGRPRDRHVGSISLSPEMRVPLSIFALLEFGCTEVWLFSTGDVWGIEKGELVEVCRRSAPDLHLRTFRYVGAGSHRYLHATMGCST